MTDAHVSPRAPPFRIFDAHMHARGIFLRQNDAQLTLPEYMAMEGIDKAVVNTVQRDANMKMIQKM